MTSETTKRFVLILLGLFVAVLITEGLLRFLGWGFFYLQERQNKLPPSSASIQLDQQKDLQQIWTEQKEFVVLCIGESTTAGIGDLWPGQLQRILNNIQDQKTFRVINKGMPGANTSTVLKNFPDWLTKYKPDFVLAMIGINDRRTGPFPEESPPSQSQRSIFSHRFRTFGLIEWIAGGLKARVTGKTEDPVTDNVLEEGYTGEQLAVYNLVHPNVTHLDPQTISNLNNMINLTTGQRAHFVFVGYALRKTDILKSVFESDAFYISNYETFQTLLKQYKYDDLFYDKFGGNFGHATTFGNRIIAGNVARQLLKLFELKKQAN